MVEFVIKIIIPLLCAVLTMYVIPLLKQKKPLKLLHFVWDMLMDI